VKAEGWYVDPYGEHDARWFSDGTPTELVRDDAMESRDPPPSTPFEGDPQPVRAPDASPDDLRRADSDEGPFDPASETDAVWDSFGQAGGGD